MHINYLLYTFRTHHRQNKVHVKMQSIVKNQSTSTCTQTKLIHNNLQLLCSACTLLHHAPATEKTLLFGPGALYAVILTRFTLCSLFVLQDTECEALQGWWIFNFHCKNLTWIKYTVNIRHFILRPKTTTNTGICCNASDLSFQNYEHRYTQRMEFY